MLSNKKEKVEAKMDTIESNDTKVNQTVINTTSIDKTLKRSEELMLVYNKDAQCSLQPNTNNHNTSQDKLKDTEKFNETRNPEEWLKYIIDKTDEMNLSTHENHKSIPQLLRRTALIWYSSEQ